ncbi:MAG: aromatic ring-hydroxylating dioxygenase subunit alpha [Rhodothermales bacterium]
MSSNGHARAFLDELDLRGEEPIERAYTIPASWYISPEAWAFEREAVFAGTWQLVARADQVAANGSVLETEVAGEPLLIIRDEEGELRAFYNVCRHRGGPIARCPGSRTMLQCRYHGWTYRLDGSLRGVPRFNRAELFDKRDYGLVPVKIDRWEDFLFVSLDDHVRPLREHFAGICERMYPVAIGGLQFHSRVTYDMACNWKVYVDNFLEGYHLPYVHPELCDILDLHAYKTELSTHYSLQYSPIAAASNPYHVERGDAFYFFVFPNLMLNILPDRLQTNVVLPLGADRCRVHFDYYYRDLTSSSALARIADDLAYSDKVQQEDIEICERVQEGLSSRSYHRGRFSVECEQGVYHFQQLLRAAYRAKALVTGSSADKP